MGGDRKTDARVHSSAAAAINRAGWNETAEAYQQRHGASLERTARAWGVWRIPEEEVAALGEVEGREVLELGCGAAQWSLALALAGARVVALDLSERQLAYARSRARAASRAVSLVQAAAERLPFADHSFDLVFCDHGGMSFADPALTVPETARVLRPGGRLVFCMTTPLRDLCVRDENDLPSDRLTVDYFGLRALTQAGEVTFQLPYGEWIRLFRRNGLRIDDLIELRPPARATTTFEDYASLEWSRRWPADHIWKLTRQALEEDRE